MSVARTIKMFLEHAKVYFFFTRFMDKGNILYELYNLSKWKNRTRINLNIKLF